MLPQRGCRIVPQNATLSVGFLWGLPPESPSYGESVGKTQCLFGALGEDARVDLELDGDRRWVVLMTLGAVADTRGDESYLKRGCDIRTQRAVGYV